MITDMISEPDLITPSMRADESRVKKTGNHALFSAGYALRKRRINSGLKAAYVADQLGLSRSYFAMLETGKRRWNKELLIKYGDLLNRIAL
jgi:hypothetical protein